MVVCAGQSGEELRWRQRQPAYAFQRSGHTTTQPSSIEEEGIWLC